MKQSSPNGFFQTRVIVAFALCFSGLALATMAWSSAAETKPIEFLSKIAPEVLAETAEGGSASVVILLADQADVSAAHEMKDQDARGWFVYNTLTQHAARTQAPLRAELEARGVGYQSFWAANMLVVTADRALIETLAARGDVARIDSNKPIRGIEPPELANFTVTPASPSAPNTVEWGVQNVNAPSVWAMGFTGQNMVIGDQDTGQRWTHNALKPQYRGWNGSSASHDYNWHDAIHSGGGTCGPNTQAPCDDQGHGTHTAGTTVGNDGAANQVGVAPGARWIGCRNMDQGNGTPATYTECFQFMIAPTDLSGNNANAFLRPHVINNSWGCPSSEGCTTRAELETIVNNTEAAGIFVAASAGNSGSGCSTVSDPPGIYSASFSVGAYDINNTLASFSSRGPSTYYTPNLLKPNISAPGVNVRSTTRTSDTSYGNLSGTSMASPHLAGVIALLWSAHPELVRNIAATKTLLQNTANPAVITSAQTCGGTPSTQIPNNSFGYGRADVFAAVNSPPPDAAVTIQVGPSGSASFDPPIASIHVGEIVKWVWASSNHSVRSGTPASPTNEFSSGVQNVPATFYHRFSTPGGYPYFCEVHGSMMSGSISVSEPATPTPTATSTPTVTATATSTPTATATATIAPTATATATSTPTATATATVAPTATATATSTPTATATTTIAPTATATATSTPTATATATVAPTATATATSTPTATATATVVPTATATATASATPFATATATATALPTATASATATATATASATATATPPTLLGNISSRLRVETGDSALIGGFILTGAQDKKVVVRALGPSLSLPDKLQNPFLELRDSSGALLQTNDDWNTSANRQAIVDSGLAPSNNLESAIIASLPANGKTYTAIVRGVGNTAGTGVVELYDADQTVDSRLANISTRGFVQTDDTILVAGTIVLGQTPQKVIVRAIGPSLNIAGKLADPILELRDANGSVIRSDDNWRTGGQENEIIQTGVAPTNDHESALIETLPANNAGYTAIVRGVNNTTGIAVVEVYALP